MSLKSWIAALLAAVVPLCATAAAPKPANRSAAFVAVDRQVDTAVASRAVPSVAIAAVERGRVVWMRTRGFADVAGRRAANADTLYRLGALSASLTGTVAAVAKSADHVDLAQPLSSYLPAYAPGSRLGSARVQELLDMTAGLMPAVHYRGLPGDFSDLDGERFVDAYAVAPVSSRERYMPSAVSPALAARAIAAGAHKPFPQYAHDRLFAPLHMSRTQCGAAGRSDARPATGYGFGQTPIAGNYAIDPPAGAGCVSSLHDLTTYVKFHLSTLRQASRLLGPVALARLHTPRAGSHHANGWEQVGSGELEQLIGGGSVDGGSAVILLAPGQRAGVIVLANTATDVTGQLAHAALDVLVPGSADAFARAQGALQAEAGSEAAGDYLPAAPWSAHGRLVAAGASRTLDVALTADGIAVRYDGGAAARGEPLERADGFARWQIPCADLLPACRQGTDARARLLLARDGDAYAGAIVVDGRLGTFPYAVHLAPAEP